jgi:hypothetical protein
MDNAILIWLGVLVGIYVLYKLFFHRSHFDEEFESLYDKVLTSEEYKVKGQYEK